MQVSDFKFKHSFVDMVLRYDLFVATCSKSVCIFICLCTLLPESLDIYMCCNLICVESACTIMYCQYTVKNRSLLMIIQDHSSPPKDPFPLLNYQPQIFSPNFLLSNFLSRSLLDHSLCVLSNFLQTEEDKKGFQIGNIFVQCLCSEVRRACFSPKMGRCQNLASKSSGF